MSLTFLIKQSIKNLNLILQMRFEDWFQYYQEIRQQFRYSTEKDQEAANLLNKLIERRSLNILVLQRKIKNKNVIAIGAGPSLESNLDFIRKRKKDVKIVSDGAVQLLIEEKIKPDIVVSDLDSNPAFLKKAENLGAMIIVHAHADNVDIMKKLVPKFKKVLGSTQVMPIGQVYNFGGFTDGDRCVFLADEMNAKSITLVGMDFEDEARSSEFKKSDTKLKKEKMKISKKLISILAKRTKSKLTNRSNVSIKGVTNYV